MSITEAGSTRTLVRDGDSLVAGSVVHTFDELGRTVMKGDLTLAYGPNGQVATATRGASSWRFVYDEDGQRLAKLTGAGAPLAAYLEDGSYLDASGLTEPVHVGGQLVGLLKNGVFQMLAVDRRGTVIADAGGTARLASPFGNRAVHPADAAAVDYVEKGYDADLGVVRMGVRDYDPTINRFTTPDPLFLEEPGQCLASPVDCNLYGYARNRPLDFVDPEGTNPVLLQQWLQRVAPVVEQAVRRAGPAVVQAARQAGPRAAQALRLAGPRLQTMGKQAVEFMKNDAKAAYQHTRNAVEFTRRAVNKIAGRVQTATPSQPAAPAAAARSALPALKVDSVQFGTKVGKHAGDFGLDPSNPAHRQWIRDRIDTIVQKYDEVRQGPWNPRGGGGKEFLFFRQGNDLVITKPNGDFVTIFPGAQSNEWFKAAFPR